MLSIVIAAALSGCEATPPLSPPQPAILDYVFEGFDAFEGHELVVDSGPDGFARYHTLPSGDAAPDPAMLQALPSEVRFMGMLLSESQAPGGGRSYRRRDLPDDLFERVNALQPGDREAFMVRHDTFLNGQREVFNRQHAITLLGCSSFQAPDGTVWPTRVFDLETASRGLLPSGQFGVIQSRIEVEIIASQGWVVRADPGDEPASMLIRATPLP